MGWKGRCQGLGPSKAPRHRGFPKQSPQTPVGSPEMSGAWGNWLRDLGTRGFSFLISLTVQAVAVCAAHPVISVCSERLMAQVLI